MLFENNFEDGKDISGFEFLKIQFLKQKLEIDYCKKFMKSKKNQLLTNFPSN